MSDRPNAHAGATPLLVFDYRGATGGGMDDLVGPWKFRPARRAPAASFAAPGAAGVTAAAEDAGWPVWRVELPPDYDLAFAHLRAGEERLRASEGALALAAKELEGVAATTRDAATSAERGAADPEALFRLLGPGRRGVSFGPGDEPPESWAGIYQQFVEFIERVRQVITHYASVETSVGGRLAGRTVVSWTGDAATVWRATPTPPLLALHKRSLALALKSREALLRTFIVVAKGAVLISSGGGVLALPVVWKYVREVMSEITAWRRMANET